MQKADLHVHSVYSEHPSEWFLQRIGAKESYTDPMKIYEDAKAAGMDFVTITDHNRIDRALRLQELYPQEVIVGVEATAYFPEDDCKIHVLIWGITAEQFVKINNLRENVYALRDYLLHEEIAHACAHATYAVNRRLTLAHLEKIILLFDVFEAVNGGRNRNSNSGWVDILTALQPSHLQYLESKYGIQPASDTPWIKGFTGGSDDHGGLFIGKTYTQAKGNTVTAFLQSIRNKESLGKGRHNTYQNLAFTVYKIAYDFTQSSGLQREKSLIGQITTLLFDKKSLGWKKTWQLKKYRAMAESEGDSFKVVLSELIDSIQKNQGIDTEAKLSLVYSSVSNLVDHLLRMLLSSLADDLKTFDVIKMVQNASSSLPGLFMLLPFFTAVSHMNQNLYLIRDTEKSLSIVSKRRKKRTLWFSDTIIDLNGVSVIIKQMAKRCQQMGRDVTLVSCLDEHELSHELPENYLNLPTAFRCNLPEYESYKIKIPSLLQSLKTISELEPDEIILSTPGPIGMVGLLMSKLLHIPCKAIYHTDFAAETLEIIKDETVVSLMHTVDRWFHSQVDELRVPTKEYIEILTSRGFDPKKMKVFRRGIDTELFYPQSNRKQYISQKSNYHDGITLMYAGRVSHDKSLDLLSDAFDIARKEIPALNLLIVGNGPHWDVLKARYQNDDRVILTGTVQHHVLPKLYSSADWFVFPSITDTFGLVILEAQACGLPVLVTQHGGPKEIMQDSETGWIVHEHTAEAWGQAIIKAASLQMNEPDKYEQMRNNAAGLVIHQASWEEVIVDLLDS